MLALRSGAPILPVAVVDSDRLWPRGHLLPKSGKHVTVRYGAPFKVAFDGEVRRVVAPLQFDTSPQPLWLMLPPVDLPVAGS